MIEINSNDISNGQWGVNTEGDISEVALGRSCICYIYGGKSIRRIFDVSSTGKSIVQIAYTDGTSEIKQYTQPFTTTKDIAIATILTQTINEQV